MSHNKPCVSVVLPVYNVEKFVDKCIANLQAQTLKSLEFIFVDDCGNDDSIKIIEKYAEIDDRIKIVHNERNMGAGATRNHGIEVATGEYISFIDPDDWMNPEFYEVLYTNAISGHFDVVKGRRIDVIQRQNGEIRYIDNKQNQNAIKTVCKGFPMYAGFIHGHQSAIYRLDMVRQNNAHYSNTSFGECGMFILMACCHTNKVCFVEGAYYYYLQREDSNAHVTSWIKYESELQAIFEQMDFAKTTLKNDFGVKKYLSAKLHFLLWRYRELKSNRENRKYSYRYLETIRRKIGDYKSSELQRQFVKSLFPRIFFRTFRKLKRVYRLYVPAKRKKIRCKFDFTKREIAYMQNQRGCVFFTKEFLEKDKDFAYHFLSDFYDYSKLYNNNLQVGSELYEEHLKYSQNNEICWKYIRRLGHISKIVIFIDEENNLCMKGEILNQKERIESRNHILLPQPTRKIIPGITLSQYLYSLQGDRTEILGELCQFLDFVFTKYAMPNSELIQGLAFDACPRNCILTEEHQYVLFDFEYEYKQPLERGFFVYLATLSLASPLRDWVYYRLCEHYGIVAKKKFWGTMIDQGWIEIMDNTTDCKYFIK